MNVGEGNPVLPAGMFQTEVGHFWVAPSLRFRRDAMCEAIDRNMIFYSHANRTHKKGFTLSLVLKVKVFGTRNWPITSIAEFILETNYPSESQRGINRRIIHQRRIIRPSINSLLRRIMELNSSEADSSVTPSRRRANRRKIHLRRMV